MMTNLSGANLNKGFAVGSKSEGRERPSNALAAMPKYEAYKESGVDWLGSVPDSWELTRLGTRFFERRAKVSDTDFPPLSVTKNGILPQLENAAKTKDGDNRKLVKNGDFVINSRSDRKGSSGVSDRDGSVSLINIVLEPKGIHPKFSEHLLKSYAFVEEYYRVGRGIVADLWTTRYDEMRTITLAVPSYEEQVAISNFLDAKTAQIDEAISIKEKQIALLKERKQIIIQKAVTQGLNTDVQMKDSGVDWIGQIPEHWRAVKLKTLVYKLESGVSVNASEAESATEDEVGVLKTSAVYRYRFDANENKKVFESEVKRVACPVKGGSVIISRMNAPDLVGASGFVEVDHPNLFLPDRLWQARFNSSNHCIPKFVSKTLISKGFRAVIESIATGSSPSMKNISKGDLLNVYVALPPESEIKDVLSTIKVEEERIDNAIDLQLTQIEKLREYKATLINSAVTGKIKVA